MKTWFEYIFFRTYPILRRKWGEGNSIKIISLFTAVLIFMNLSAAVVLVEIINKEVIVPPVSYPLALIILFPLFLRRNRQEKLWELLKEKFGDESLNKKAIKGYLIVFYTIASISSLVFLASLR